eukprot:6989-Pelagomonas_calceolata.AAC.1
MSHLYCHHDNKKHCEICHNGPPATNVTSAATMTIKSNVTSAIMACGFTLPGYGAWCPSVRQQRIIHVSMLWMDLIWHGSKDVPCMPAMGLTCITAPHMQ